MTCRKNLHKIGSGLPGSNDLRRRQRPRKYYDVHPLCLPNHFRNKSRTGYESRPSINAPSSRFLIEHGACADSQIRMAVCQIVDNLQGARCRHRDLYNWDPRCVQRLRGEIRKFARIHTYRRQNADPFNRCANFFSLHWPGVSVSVIEYTTWQPFFTARISVIESPRVRRQESFVQRPSYTRR